MGWGVKGGHLQLVWGRGGGCLLWWWPPTHAQQHPVHLMCPPRGELMQPAFLALAAFTTLP